MAMCNKLTATILAPAFLLCFISTSVCAQATSVSMAPPYGDSPANPGPRAMLSGSTRTEDVHAAMKLVADWQLARVKGVYSQDWPFSTLYVGFLAASRTLRDRRYAAYVHDAGEHFHWTLGPNRTLADDQAIGQSYLEFYNLHPDARIIAPLRKQFNDVMSMPDDPKKPVWWWCDALFMAPPVWAALSQVTGDPKYDAYMDHEWKITDNLLWDKQEHLFFRDATYLDKREKGGQKIFWSRGNGWVMGGLARVLEVLPRSDPSYAFYMERFRQMAAKIATLQRPDGLWSPSLLDTPNYPLPEVSGSSFFVYALAWGVNHRILDAKLYRPVIDRGWKGLIDNIYADGRLGSMQPSGAGPGPFLSSSSYPFGIGAFLMAGSEVSKLPNGHRKK